jgi:hypothetical protein
LKKPEAQTARQALSGKTIHSRRLWISGIICYVADALQGGFTMRSRITLKLAMAGMLAAAAILSQGSLLAQNAGRVLKPAELEKLLPASLFYRGQSATIQVRNSGGVKFDDGYYILATLVDTSGYSTGVAAKYQGQLIAEVPVKIAGQSLPAGVYGIGFIADNKFLVTDVGAHDVLSVDSTTDEALKRPTPLQVVAGPSGDFRLYAGRRYVVIGR